jgi:hypothetical protein
MKASPLTRCRWVWIVPAKVSVKVMNTTPPDISQNEAMFSTWL